MADTEFEEFRHHFERLPQHIKASAHIYTLVHDVSPDTASPTSPRSDTAGSSSSGCSHATTLNNAAGGVGGDLEADEEDEGGGEERRAATPGPGPPPEPELELQLWGDTGQPQQQQQQQQQHRPERRRRKLPEIPKNKKSALMAMVQPSLADELGDALSGGAAAAGRPDTLQFALGACPRPLIVLKCRGYLRDEDSSPDSEYFHSTDVDSGNSTAHSPDGPKSMSPQLTLNAGYRSAPGSRTPSPASPGSAASVPYTRLELLEATHRGLHKFVPRHHDELEVEIGDPIYVQKEADDLWCEGVNLRSGVQGIFPSAYVVDTDYSDFDPSTPRVKRERYLLGYLGSVETKYHKGNAVLCQAVRKIVGPGGVPKQKPHSCILEVSDQGLRMVDKRKPAPRDVPCHDYFYSLKNVSFCAFHPRDHRYLGFVTKHPQFQRFACHVFMGCESTRPVAEAIGRAFQRFYTKFIETAYPIEDIYIE